jgi:hypothetical protein
MEGAQASAHRPSTACSRQRMGKYALLLCIIIMHYYYASLCIIMHHYALQLPTDTDTAQHSREKTIENVLLLQPFRVKNDETTDC